MPLYQIMPKAFRAIPESTFIDLKLYEQRDLQRRLRTQISILGDDLYVLAEEFGDWEGSRREIDLLAIDLQGNLVVIELKRTDDGGHMELQAIRYAAMVSAMTFEKAVQIHADFLRKIEEKSEDAGERVLEFLGWDEPDEENFATDVRIILVSENFGKELTTAVLWLRERDLDIRCIRLLPYKDEDACYIDVQQLIPLPEADDYQVKLKAKEQVGKKEKGERLELYLRFWQGLLDLAKAHETRHSEISPGTHQWIKASSGFRALDFKYTVLKYEASIELYIDRNTHEDNKRIFDALLERKTEIETAFGNELVWDCVDNRRACIIRYVLPSGGYRSDVSMWGHVQKEMVMTMIRFESALLPRIESLNLKGV